MNFKKFLRAALFIEYLLRLLLNVDFVKCAFYSTIRKTLKHKLKVCHINALGKVFIMAFKGATKAVTNDINESDEY